MIWITPTDLEPKITDQRLAQITQGDADVTDEAESIATAVITDALADRYDTTAIFGTSGSDRPMNVVRWMTTLMLYYLYERIADKMVPQRVIKNYDDTLADLKAIEKGEKSVQLPRLIIDTVNQTKFRWGSQPALSH